MIDIKSSSLSITKQASNLSLCADEVYLTFTENIDEQDLYKDLSKRLIELEKSVNVNKEELELIKEMANKFRLAIEEKDEILLRIDWLHRLYKAKEEIGYVNTKEKVTYLRRLIARVQTCPMKKQLMSEINALEQLFPSEAPKKETSEDILMEKTINEVGDVFINLGKAGREYVIKDVLEQFGDNASAENVKEFTLALEKRVESLLEVNEHTKMVTRLEQLPVKSFSRLETARKEFIAERLLESKKWNGLATLERIILQHDRSITAENKKKREMENTIELPDGKAVTTLVVENGTDGIITIE